MADWERPLQRSTLLVVGVITLVWLGAILSDTVPLDYLGDEAGRLLGSYAASSPRGIVSLLSEGTRWVELHPPGDAAARGLVNWVVGPAVGGSDGFIRLQQVVSWVCVVGGVGAAAHGAWTRWGATSGLVFALLALGSSPVVYVAHHIIGEAPSVLLVGLATRWALVRDPADDRWPYWVGLPLLGAALFRPEAAVVFGGLALIALHQRRVRSSMTVSAFAVVFPIVTTVAIELSPDPESYASIRRFPRVGFIDVVTDERMRDIIWGFGVGPYLGVVFVLVVVAIAAKSRDLSLGALLTVGWLALAVLFTSQIAVGAIHQQERAFVFPALFGALAISAVVGEWDGRVRVRAGVVAAAAVAAGLGLVSTVQHTYPAWSDRVPVDAREVAALLVERSADDDAILLDWMWWQEWRAAVYASDPGLPGSICVYASCPTDLAPGLVDTAGLDPVNAERLLAAATFVRDEEPRHLVVFSDEMQAEWDQFRSNKDPLPSFVRPLFATDVDRCWVALGELGGARYCPVLSNRSYVVFERVP